MKKARWSQIDAICRAFETVAGPEIRCWVEDVGDVVAGERPERHFTPCTQRVGGTDQAEVIAGVDGRGSHAWIDIFASVVRTTIEQQNTINDMASATARTWRQMNALLAMASSSSLGLEPGKTIQRIFDMLVRATRFEGGIAIVRLPGSEDCIQLDANGVARVPQELLAGLELVGATVRTFSESPEEDEVLRACVALLDPFKPGAVGRLQTDHDVFGWLIAATSDTLSSDDLKLFGAAARIIAFALENSHTLALEREAARAEGAGDLYRVLAKTAPVGIFRADIDGQVLYVNDRWCSVTGVPEEEALRDDWLCAVHEDDQARLTTEWERMVVEGKPLRCEHRCRRDDGRAWVLTEIAHEAREDGGFVGTMTDITDHKRAEHEKAELQANLGARPIEAVGVPAGAIAHDFNDIVASIIGDAELAIGRIPEGDHTRVHLDSLLQGALRARDLARRMLASGGGAADDAPVPERADSVLPTRSTAPRSPLHEFAQVGRRDSAAAAPASTPGACESPTFADHGQPADSDLAERAGSSGIAADTAAADAAPSGPAQGDAAASSEPLAPLATHEESSLEDLVATFLAVEDRSGATPASVQAEPATALVPRHGTALTGAGAHTVRAARGRSLRQISGVQRLRLPASTPARLPGPDPSPASMGPASPEPTEPEGGEDGLLEKLVAEFLATEQPGREGSTSPADVGASAGGAGDDSSTGLPALRGEHALTRGRLLDRAPQAQRGRVKLLGSDRTRRLEHDPAANPLPSPVPRALPQPPTPSEPAPAARSEPRKLSFPFMIG